MMAQHVRVRSRCGACGFFFQPEDRFYLFVQRGLASSFSGRFSGYGEFSFPFSFYFENDHDSMATLWMCRLPNRRQCQHSPESTAVHSDCLKLFLGLQQDFEIGLRKLWVAATWRSPWPGAPSLNMDPDLDMQTVAKIPGLSRLKSLPLELCAMTQEYSLPSALWYCTVLELAHQLSAFGKHKQQSIPLTSIRYWDRGESPEADDGNHSPFIRLVIDSKGICRIERFKRSPLEIGSSSAHVKYVVGAAKCFLDVVVDFALGLARLQLPLSSYIWDIPCPPLSLERFVIPTPPPCHLGTIQTRGCIGITFFIGFNDFTYAVHAHTRSQPSAQSTARGLASWHEADIAWVYVPLLDGLEEFGFSQLPESAAYNFRAQCFLLRSKIGGYVFVGPFRMQPRKFVRVKRPLALIYQNQEAAPISFLGAYSREHQLEICTGPRHNPRPPSSLRHPHFSSASLERVCQVQIFYIPGNALCRGLILQYEDGQRALGQCRVGFDPTKEWAQPSYICYINTKYDDKPTSRRLQGIEVEVSIQASHCHEKMGWTCCNMSGVLNFWFTAKEAKLEYFVLNKTVTLT